MYPRSTQALLVLAVICSVAMSGGDANLCCCTQAVLTQPCKTTYIRVRVRKVLLMTAFSHRLHMIAYGKFFNKVWQIPCTLLVLQKPPWPKSWQKAIHWVTKVKGCEWYLCPGAKVKVSTYFHFICVYLWGGCNQTISQEGEAFQCPHAHSLWWVVLGFACY